MVGRFRRGKLRMADARGVDDRVRSVLNDGTPVLMRPIEPGDRECLRDGMRRLSPESARYRFLSPVSRLSEVQLRYLTEIDYRDHMAWVAFDVGGPGPLGIGVARYIRLADAPATAEMAITVVDSHQGRGLGSRLFSLLAGSAVRNGIDTIIAEVLRENTAALKVLRALGGEVTAVNGLTAHVELAIGPAPYSATVPAAGIPKEPSPKHRISR